jgi:hypothetical protein
VSSEWGAGSQLLLKKKWEPLVQQESPGKPVWSSPGCEVSYFWKLPYRSVKEFYLQQNGTGAISVTFWPGGLSYDLITTHHLSVFQWSLGNEFQGHGYQSVWDPGNIAVVSPTHYCFSSVSLPCCCLFHLPGPLVISLGH